MKHSITSIASEARILIQQPSITPIRIAIVSSHAIQYFTPYYRALAQTPGVILRVFFCSDRGVESYYDKGFGSHVKWDIPLLEGYDSEFLEKGKENKFIDYFGINNPTVSKSLERFAPDIVEINGYTQQTIWRTIHWCNENKVPVILHSDSNGSAKRPLWKRVIKKPIVKYIYNRLDAALSSGDNNKKYHLKYGLPIERIFSRPIPIDCEYFSQSAGDKFQTRKNIRDLYGIPDDAFVVIFSGKLSAVKCPMHLLKALHQCAQKGFNIWGLFVGEGTERVALKSYIFKHNLKRIIMTGFVNQSSIAKYYIASDVLALMSSYEPKGQVVPEAGCLGCPAVLTDRVGCIGPNDCARPDENVLVYPWSDIDAMTECIIRLYKDKELYSSMSEAAKRISILQDCRTAAKQMRIAAITLKRMEPRE